MKNSIIISMIITSMLVLTACDQGQSNTQRQPPEQGQSNTQEQQLDDGNTPSKQSDTIQPTIGLQPFESYLSDNGMQYDIIAMFEDGGFTNAPMLGAGLQFSSSDYQEISNNTNFNELKTRGLS